MNITAVFITVGALVFLVSLISLALLVIASGKKQPVRKWAIGLIVSLILLAGVIVGDIVWLQNSKVPLSQTYNNPDYGLSFNYPNGWRKNFDSMNRAFPSQLIDTKLSFEMPGDGVNKSLRLNSFGGSLILTAPPGKNTVGVYRNTGNNTDPVWTELSVGLAGVDSPGTKDCLWSAEDNTVVFASAPAAVARAVLVEYAITGWSALIGFVSPDGQAFFVVDISRLGYGQSFSAWSQTWETSPKTNEDKAPNFERFISSGAAQLSGFNGRERTYTDTQLGGRECKDYVVSANGWVYEVMTSTAKPAKYSDWQSTIKAMLASINITAPNPTQ